MVEWIVANFSEIDAWTAYLLIAGVLFICGLGIPIPEDIVLITAGWLVSRGTISFEGATLAGLLGVVSGDALLFSVGRILGRRVFELRWTQRLFPPERIEEAERRIQDHGRAICFIARFLPGLRSPVFLTAGVMRISAAVFVATDGLAALISVPLWVWFGAYFGEELEHAVEVAKRFQVWIGLAVITGVGWYLWRTWPRVKESR
jgi:membrane protein DedA with SNARE-associated domain